MHSKNASTSRSGGNGAGHAVGVQIPAASHTGGSDPSSPASHQSNAVKVVIHHGDDRLVVAVLLSATLNELTEKVSKKIRLVSGRKVDNLKIRYIDEDGDRILMHDDEDVQMAFETSRNLGADVDLVVS